MKTYLSFILALLSLQSYCQSLPALISVTFPDNKSYWGNVLKNSGEEVKAQFYNSGSIYTFDSDGKIISSTGTYKTGSTASVIRIRSYMADLYSQGYVENGKIIGVEFGDGVTYYGNVEGASAGWFSIRFLHSNSQYSMQYTDGLWKVRSTEGGKYPAGSVLKRLFSITDIKYFFPQ